jgi:predicted RNA-binding Zn-ribbon protein involved in translation (DUF1610 family)
MNLYKVWIQIKQVDQGRNHPHSVGPRYEAGEFNSEAEATRFVKNELLIVRPVKLDLQKVCQAGLKFLDSLPATELTSQKQNRDAFRKMLTDALNRNAPIVDDSCPKCGAGYKERELVGREFIDIEAIHVHYRCNRCGSRMIEEFKLADVFMYEPPTP